MKGFVGVVLGHVPDYDGCEAETAVHVALTYDEELGCLGIPHLITAMAQWNIHPAGCIVGEPTSMRLVSAHKGGRVYRCRVTGRAAHSSLTDSAVNAIEYASAIIGRIQAIGARERDRGLRAPGFDVPFTTISTNLFSGGNGPNIVPASAEFTFDYRTIPGFDAETIIAELSELAAELAVQMRRIAPETGIEFIPINEIPALAPDETADIHRLALGLLAEKMVEKVGYGTEASFFQRYGVPSIVCGPGSIVQAHKADEYVALDQLRACDDFIEGVVRHLST